jgi:hypothetical protein
MKKVSFYLFLLLTLSCTNKFLGGKGGKGGQGENSGAKGKDGQNGKKGGIYLKNN